MKIQLVGNSDELQLMERNIINAFLQFNENEILNNSGKVTAEIEKAFEESEYDPKELGILI